MPFKSKAQQRWMFAAEERGEVPPGTAERWAKETPNLKELPERKDQKTKKRKKGKKKKATQAQMLIKAIRASKERKG